MERLTHRKEDWYWKDEEFWLSAENPSLEKIDAVYYKLAEFEDFMEANDIEDLKELQRQIDLVVDVLALDAENSQLKNVIDDLEAKLAEREDKQTLCTLSDKQLKQLEEYNNQIKQQLIAECKEHQEFCKVADAKVKELEQQLAEKEKEIYETYLMLKQFYSRLGVEAFGEDIHEQALKKLNRLTTKDYKKSREIAIEELERIKHYVRHQLFVVTNSATELEKAEAKGCNDAIKDIEAQINQQIKLLKGGA